MKSLHYVIVHADQPYNNEKDLGDGLKIVTNTTIESVAHINRVATVKAAPGNTLLKTGDEVIVHHNIFRHKNDTQGERRKSDFFIKDKEYFVPLDMVFAYRRDKGEWEALAPYFFVKPIEKEIEKTDSGIYLESGLQKYVHREAEVRFSNKQLREEWGVQEGDVVGYGKNQEYEFEIDGEMLYRVRMPKLLYKKCKA